jgi:hypothetical protein
MPVIGPAGPRPPENSDSEAHEPPAPGRRLGAAAKRRRHGARRPRRSVSPTGGVAPPETRGRKRLGNGSDAVALRRSMIGRPIQLRIVGPGTGTTRMTPSQSVTGKTLRIPDPEPMIRVLFEL